MTVKQLPDEKAMLEILEMVKDFEQSAREMCEMSTAIAHKYQKRMQAIRETEKEQSDAREEI
ncbi:MAG: hypothetical protein ACM37W_05140 [Actinomycetota bacterium]